MNKVNSPLVLAIAFISIVVTPVILCFVIVTSVLLLLIRGLVLCFLSSWLTYKSFEKAINSFNLLLK